MITYIHVRESECHNQNNKIINYCHTSHIIHPSYIIYHTSYIIHHTSYIIHPYIHTSYIIHHTSYIQTTKLLDTVIKTHFQCVNPKYWSGVFFSSVRLDSTTGLIAAVDDGWRLLYIIHHTSYIIHHTSYIIHHTSYILYHTSYIIHHTSHITHIHTHTHLLKDRQTQTTKQREEGSIWTYCI